MVGPYWVAMIIYQSSYWLFGLSHSISEFKKESLLQWAEITPGKCEGNKISKEESYLIFYLPNEEKEYESASFMSSRKI